MLTLCLSWALTNIKTSPYYSSQVVSGNRETPLAGWGGPGTPPPRCAAGFCRPHHPSVFVLGSTPTSSSHAAPPSRSLIETLVSVDLPTGDQAEGPEWEQGWNAIHRRLSETPGRRLKTSLVKCDYQVCVPLPALALQMRSVWCICHPPKTHSKTDPVRKVLTSRESAGGWKVNTGTSLLVGWEQEKFNKLSY